MSRPQHAAANWDDEADVTNALNSLDQLGEVPGMPGVDLSAVRGTAANAPVSAPASAPAAVPPATPAPSATRAATTALPNNAPQQPVLTRKAAPDQARTLRRPQPRPQSTAPVAAVPSMPYDAAAVPVASTAPAMPEELPAGVGYAATPILSLVILVLRLALFALCALVLLLAIPTVGARLNLMAAANLVTGLLPKEVAGLFVLQTPFGGALRGDLVITAFALSILEWLLTCLRARLRRR